LNDNDKDNTFKEELEKELETGLANTPDEGRSDDFTVRVRREDYIVKRRFYDKDKALETAESLRRDRRNLVEDNIEGQALSSSNDDDDDEKVDWDKLVDAGLVFDPPIAEAAEKKPGEEPVGLADDTPRPEVDDKILEKTLLVKRPRPQVIEETIEEDVDFDGEDDEAVDGSVPQADGSTERKKRRLMPLLLIVAAVAAAVVSYTIMTRDGEPEHRAQAPVPSREPVVQAIPAADPSPVAESMPAPEPVTPVEPIAVSAPPEPAPRPENAVKPLPDPAAVVPAPAAEPVPESPLASEPPQAPVTVIDHFTHTVHVSSYRDRDRANHAVSLLRKKGHDAFTGVVRIPGKGDWFRVYVGYLTSLDEAKALADTIKNQMREDTVPRKMPWAIQVGDTASLGTIDPMLQALRARGYAVNTVPVARNSDMVRILTGAFASENEAATMVSLLTGDGFSARVVQR
jgi:cell division septation protein DedD